MNNVLKQTAKLHGDRLQIISVEHLADLQKELEDFKKSDELNGFQQWIVENLYQYDIPKTEYEVRSIILLAVHRPFCAKVELSYQGQIYKTRSLVHAQHQEAKSYLTQALNLQGYHAYEVGNLSMKRLAVQSGLAVYGRNNITYVEDLGSNLSYLTFFSDAPCEVDEWRKVCHAEICNTCNHCVEQCPTGAIRKDRFLIDNQRCLSCLNESGGEFPDWLPEDVHHTLYDCLRCQEKCPLNDPAYKDVIGPICFSEEETTKLLDGKRLEDFSEEFKIKAEQIGLFDWPEGLPRNIRAIMKAQDY